MARVRIVTDCARVRMYSMFAAQQGGMGEFATVSRAWHGL